MGGIRSHGLGKAREGAAASAGSRCHCMGTCCAKFGSKVNLFRCHEAGNLMRRNVWIIQALN